MKARRWCLLLVGFLAASACPWNDDLRKFLNHHFWMPFAKQAPDFERPNVRRVDVAYAGMTAAKGDGPMARLRAAYQKLPGPRPDMGALRQAVTTARGERSLTGREREEVDLVEAKIEMRAGEADDPGLLESARKKLEAFLRTARVPEFRSEARGWLAHVYYVSGDQTAAGKIYLDELNRSGSNLSRETLLNSLHMTYGYTGGTKLAAHLGEYFDTPEHAAFAIQLTTNPRSYEDRGSGRFGRPHDTSGTYRRIKELLAMHPELLRSDALTLLAMRTALRMGDPGEAREIAERVPAGADTRGNPDYLWMSASALFLSGEYAAAERPLLELFGSKRADASEQAAAAYGLCGVYWKTHNVEGQLRYALWLYGEKSPDGWGEPSDIANMTVYWAASGWDLGLLLEGGASVDELRAFAEKNAGLRGIRIVRYAVAVRLAREERYAESAELYRAIQAYPRARRMRQLAALKAAEERAGSSAEQKLEARYAVAAFMAANPNGIYYNDSLWHGMQSYALYASTDSRVTGAERRELMEKERELRDSQEERWRAYLMVKEMAGASGLGRRAAALGVRCLRGISVERFGREEEIRKGDVELSRWVSASKER